MQWSLNFAVTWCKVRRRVLINRTVAKDCDKKDTLIYIIILDPNERRTTTMRSNDTLVDTPLKEGGATGFLV